MTQEEYSAFYDSIDFMEGALNVYRTKNYIVRQELSIENIEGKTVIFSRDTFFKKTENRNEASLKKRLDVSKTFVLIVGENTKNLRGGSCAYCGSYNSYQCRCVRGYSVDFRSYINYECDKAVDADIKIVVLYNSTKVDKSKCPEALKDKGIHVAMRYKEDGVEYWDYQAVKNAIMN